MRHCITVHGTTVDITAFLDEHPGGREVLLKYAGRDASAAFDSIGHGPRARNLLKTLPACEMINTRSDALPSTGGSTSGGDFSLGKDAPQQPMRLPFLGNTLDMIAYLANPQQAFLALCTRLQRAVRVDFGLFRNPMVAIVDPRLARRILDADNTHFLKGPGYAAIHTITPFHLLVTEGGEWQSKRKAIVGALHALVSGHLSKVQPHACRLVEHLLQNGGGYTEDLPGVVRASALDLISEIVLGEPLGKAEGSALHTLMNEWHLRVTDVVPLWKIGWRTTRLGRAKRTLFTYLEARVRAMRAADAADAIRGCLAACCWLHLPDAEVTELMFTLIAMGHENVSSAISWAFANLCAHPNWQHVLAAEIRARDLPENHVHSAADVCATAMPSLDAFINETLRLAPPIPMLSRRSVVAGAVDGLLPGEELLVNPYVLHRLPWLWKDAPSFDPSRWTRNDDGGKAAGAAAEAFAVADALTGTTPPELNTAAYMPFGAGPRACPGQEFALFEMKALLVAVLQRADVSFASGTVAAKEGLFISLRPAPFAMVARTRLRLDSGPTRSHSRMEESYDREKIVTEQARYDSVAVRD